MTEDLTLSNPKLDRVADDVLLIDRFEVAAPPGRVIGTRSTSGAQRLVTDRERSISIDNGQLRMGWLAHPGYGRSAISYGPFEMADGLVVVVRALNGLTTSQSDPRPEGRRAMLRRIAATFPRATLDQPRLRDSLTIGWFSKAISRRAPEPIAAMFHRAGEDATGELWFQAGETKTRIARDLQNLPGLYAIELRSTSALLFAWSYPGAHGFSDPGDREPLAELEVELRLPSAVFAAIHQPVLGEVRYRVDTRVTEVRVTRTPALAAVDDSDRNRWWQPVSGRPTITDGFDGGPGDLDGTRTSDGTATWARVLGDGVLARDGAGEAAVRASVAAPNPGRTVYCVGWTDTTGVEVSATITPPGRARGHGEQGRSGLVVWQDRENHLVVNHFIDDGSVGVSISAFLRTGGQETMFEWDAVWSNVAHRVQWGQPFVLSVACDGQQFLCRVGGEPVLYRAFTDYRVDAKPMQIRGVGLVANWEWGDDTGTRFDNFSVRPLTVPEAGWSSQASRGGLPTI